jgi:hypothetical protein
MPSPRRSPSPSRSAISGLALLLAALSGCGDDDSCGPGDEEATGVTVGTITFGNFAASANNDCPPTAGEHPTSITVQGEQISPEVPGQFLVFCLPRPDLIDDQPVSFTDGERFELVDLFGQDGDGCTVRFDDTAEPGSAAATFSGFCDNGTNEAGFALTLSGNLPVARTCDGDPAEADVAALDGRAAVVAGSAL